MKNKINITKLAASMKSNLWAIDDEAYGELVKSINTYSLSHNSSLDKFVNALSKLLLSPDKDEFTVDTVRDTTPGTAVIPVIGILLKGASEDEEAEFGLCNIDRISEALDEASADESVTDICLSFDSPGGEVTGIPELARKIALINDTIKPICAWTEKMSCSAAYWIMSQCSNIGMTDSATIGNVGVYSLMENRIKELSMEGIEIIPFVSGKFKLMGHSFHELTAEEKTILLAGVEATNNKFKEAIKSKRNITDDNLEGLSYGGGEALKLGYADVVVDDFNQYMAVTYNKDNNNNNNNMKFSKFANSVKEAFAVASAIKAEAPEKVDEKKPDETKATAPVEDKKEEPKAEKVEDKKEEPAAKEDKKAETQEIHLEFACPYCSKKFGVTYDPTKPQGESPTEKVEEKAPVDEKKEDEKVEDKKEDEKVDEKKEDEKVDEKKATSPSWSQLAFGVNSTKAENAFKTAINEQYKDLKL